jgi:lipopolysaccharide transport system permease protein
MSTNAIHSTSPVRLFHSLWLHRHLLGQLTRREIVGRYRGSTLGLLWSFFNPILMLAVYTFVFSVVFKMRWNIGGEETRSQFATVLFVGIILHTILAECLTRAPNLIAQNVNYVKRVVFPLELLPIVTMGAALFHALISFSVLLLALLILNAGLHWSILLTPLVVFPFTLLLLGLSWILAAIGVYLRDVSHVMTMLVMILMFLAPIFYPLSMIPEHYQFWLYFNPLTIAVEQARAVIIFGTMPDWLDWFIYLLIALTVSLSGFALFQKARRGFADVL